MSDLNPALSAQSPALPLAPQSLLSLGRRQNSLGATNSADAAATKYSAGVGSPRKASMSSVTMPIVNTNTGTSGGGGSGNTLHSPSASLGGSANAWSSLQDRELSAPSSSYRRWVDYGDRDRVADRDRATTDRDRATTDRGSWKRGDRPEDRRGDRDRLRFDRSDNRTLDRSESSADRDRDSISQTAPPLMRARSDTAEDNPRFGRFERSDRDTRPYDRDRDPRDRPSRFTDDRVERFQRDERDRDRVTDWGDRDRERERDRPVNRDRERGHRPYLSQATGRFDTDTNDNDTDSRQSQSYSRSTSSSQPQQADPYVLQSSDVARLNAKYGPVARSPQSYSRDTLLSLYRPSHAPLPPSLIDSLGQYGLLCESSQPPVLATPMSEVEQSLKSSGQWIMPPRRYDNQQQRGDRVGRPNQSLSSAGQPRRQTSSGYDDRDRRDHSNRSSDEHPPAWADTPVAAILAESTTDLSAIHEQSAQIELERQSMRRQASAQLKAASLAQSAIDRLSSNSPSQASIIGNPPPSLTSVRWFYKDPQNETQGPFCSADMKDWYEKGYFDLELPIQCMPASSPVPPTNFAPLGSWFMHGKQAFLDRVPSGFVRREEPSLPMAEQPMSGLDSLMRRSHQRPEWDSHPQSFDNRDDDGGMAEFAARSLRLDEERRAHAMRAQSANTALQHQSWSSQPAPATPTSALYGAHAAQPITAPHSSWGTFASPSHAHSHTSYHPSMASPQAGKSLQQHFPPSPSHLLHTQPAQHDAWLQHHPQQPQPAQQLHFSSHPQSSAALLHDQHPHLSLEQQQTLAARQRQQQSANVIAQHPSLQSQQHAAALARERLMQSSQVHHPNYPPQPQFKAPSVADPEFIPDVSVSASIHAAAHSAATHAPIQPPALISAPSPIHSQTPSPTLIAASPSPAPLIPTAGASARSPVGASANAARWAAPVAAIATAKPLSLAEIQSAELEEGKRRAAQLNERHRQEDAAAREKEAAGVWGKPTAATAVAHPRATLSSISTEEEMHSCASVNEEIAPSKPSAASSSPTAVKSLHPAAEAAENDSKSKKKAVTTKPAASPVSSKPASAWGAPVVPPKLSVDLRAIQQQEEIERRRQEELAAQRVREQQAAAAANTGVGSVWGGINPLVASAKPSMSLKEIQALEAQQAAARVEANSTAGGKSLAAIVGHPAATPTSAWGGGSTAAKSGASPSTASSAKNENIWDYAPNGNDTAVAPTASANKAAKNKTATKSSAESASANSAASSAPAFGVDVSMSDDLATWCRGELQTLTGSNDLTLVQYLLTLDDDEAIEETILTYLGAGDSVRQFATKFCQLSQFDRKQSRKPASVTSDRAKDGVSTTKKSNTGSARRKRASGK